MPWKDFYWTLQEDPSLRFVRETHIREIIYLGIALPFALDGSMIRLNAEFPAPIYPGVVNVPERLFFSCPIKQFPGIREHGLRASRRSLVLTADKDLAARIARRRTKEPITIEVFASKAVETGVEFRQAGPLLFLVDSIPAVFLLLPKLRDDVLAEISAEFRDSRGAKEKRSVKAHSDVAPGSFMMDPMELERIYGTKVQGGKPGGRGGTGRGLEKRLTQGTVVKGSPDGVAAQAPASTRYDVAAKADGWFARNVVHAPPR